MRRYLSVPGIGRMTRYLREFAIGREYIPKVFK